MITLEEDSLVFRFPEVHEEAVCRLDLQRTLRIPDDGEDYPLPPGLGRFPLRHLDDFAGGLPETWHRRGGVIMPMHQAEAMWLHFGGSWRGLDYPFAVKIATGKINAVTGEPWRPSLNRDPQDYVVVPKQPWLDGYCVEKGVIRQFVAMPLGEGYTVEEQLTGEAEHGGLQIVAYPMKRERYEALRMPVSEMMVDEFRSVHRLDMGLAAGGRMRQEVYDDPYGLDAWDQRHSSRCFVTIANSLQWAAIIGEAPPTEPPTAQQYNDAGLPWFEYYDADAKAVQGSVILAAVKSVVGLGKSARGTVPVSDPSVTPRRVVKLGSRRRATIVRESML